MKTYYTIVNTITTISLISMDLYGMIYASYPYYALIHGAVLGMVMYCIWFRGTFEEKQSSLPQEMVGKEQKTN